MKFGKLMGYSTLVSYIGIAQEKFLLKNHTQNVVGNLI